MKVALDTNCFIDAATPNADAYAAMRCIFEAHESRTILVVVSRHTLSELLDPPDARRLAEALPALPHWPIGTIGEQVATIEQLAGTWAEDHARDLLARDPGRTASRGRKRRETCIWTQMDPSSASGADSTSKIELKTKK
jgi:hypothetical protein